MIKSLKETDHRLTPQRLAVLRVLADSAGHPSVEEIYEQVRQQHPMMSLATVYKTVETLKEMGQVLELEFSGAGNRYDGRQAEPYEHDMKLWWAHTEALYACLLAHHLTGEERWAEWYERVHAWAFAHFADREHGEWFGYLRRDGTISSTVKGNLWKGPFHLPRMQLYAWKLLEEIGLTGAD